MESNRTNKHRLTVIINQFFQNHNFEDEETYYKKSQLEHILLHPDKYIGAVEPVTELMCF